MKNYPLVRASQFATRRIEDLLDSRDWPLPDQVETARGYQQARDIFRMNMAKTTVLVSGTEISPGFVSWMQRQLDSDLIVINETDQPVRVVESAPGKTKFLEGYISLMGARRRFAVMPDPSPERQITYGPAKRRKKGKDKRY